MEFNLTTIVSILYYVGIMVVIMGLVLEIFDLIEERPFSFWLTACLALASFFEFPIQIMKKNYFAITQLTLTFPLYLSLTITKYFKQKQHNEKQKKIKEAASKKLET